MDENDLLLGIGGEAPNPEELTIGSVKLIDDGIVIQKTLTGFEQNQTYTGVPANQRFSDHALILYPSQGIGTFNIAFQAKNTKILGTDHYAHKFPMEATSPLNETDELYIVRLTNIFNLCKAELDKGPIHAIVFQEALAAIDAVHRTAPFDKKAYGFLRNGEFCIFYKADAGKYIQESPLIPADFENNTGMKTAKFATLKETLEKKITVYRNAVKKQLLFNVHIPGLNLETGPVKQRRANTLKLLTEIQALYAAKPEFATYTAIFVGDFNVPLIGQTQENSDVFQTITIPMEIHTTPQNEGFSYIDHNRTRTTGNIDYLVKLPLTAGGGGPPARIAAEPTSRHLRFANEVGKPLTTTEPNGSIVSENTETRARNGEEDENEESFAKPIAANTNLPTTLRIGNGGKFDEFINLTEKTFTSTGGFSILHKGGQKELQELYSVRDTDRLAVLQKAFGIQRLSDTPPLMAVLEQECTPDYDVNTVDQALESRIDTLEAELASMSETTQKGMKRAFLKVLQELLDSVRGLPDDTPCPSPKGSDRPGPGAEPQPTGCPCLDDLDLLRDLVILVVTLMGIASPQVKAQLEEIHLDDILGLIQDGNSASATVRLREVLATLGDLELATGDETGGDGNLQEVLVPIWQALTPDNVPEVLTLDIVITKIREIISTSTDTLAASHAKFNQIKAEIVTKEEEFNALQAQLAEYRAGAATAEQLAAARAELAAKEAELAAAQARITQLTDAFGAAGAAAGEAGRKQDAELTGLRGKLATAETARNTATARVTRLEGELGVSRAETGAATAQLAALTAERDAAKAEVTKITQELVQKNAEIIRLNKTLLDLGAEKVNLEASMAAGKLNVQNTLAEKNTKIAELQNQLEDCTRKNEASNLALTAANELLDEKDAEIAALKARAEAAESESGKTRAASEAATAQLAELTARLDGVTAELEGLRSSQADAEAAIAAEKENLDRKAAELAGVQPALKAQIAALEASGAEAEGRATAAEAETARLTAELNSAQEGLLRATQEHEAEKADAEAQKRTLATKLTELEGRIRTTEEAAEAITTGSSTKDAELAQLRADKVALQAELDALKAKGPEQAAALAAAEAEFKRQIETCQDQLGVLRTEKNRNLAAKNAELVTQKSAHEKTIAELQAQIAEAEAKVAKAETNTQGTIAAVQKASNEQRNANVAAAKAEADKAKKNSEEAIQAVTAGAAAKNAEIADLKEQLAAAKKAKQECDETLAKKQAELNEISASLPEPGEIEAQAALKAAEMQKNAAEKGGLRAHINELETKISSLQSTLATLGAPSEETESKLNTLLGVILVDPELKEEAKKYMKSGDDMNLEPLKAKKSDTGILSPELCDFYTYLYGIISLQSKKLPKVFQPDILQKFKTPPTADKNKELLKEIALIFQAFFIMGETTTIPEDLSLSVDVPQISTFINSLDRKPLKLKEGVESDSFGRELWGTGLLGEFALMSKEGTPKLTLTKLDFKSYLQEFVQNNTRKVLPLAVLAIKLIQLLHNDLNEKYFDIRTKCGMTATFKREVAPPAAEVELKGGGDDSDEIESEEFTL